MALPRRRFAYAGAQRGAEVRDVGHEAEQRARDARTCHALMDSDAQVGALEALEALEALAARVGPTCGGALCGGALCGGELAAERLAAERFAAERMRGLEVAHR